MKKFYVLVAATMIALLGSSAFAKSDLQVQLGYRGVTTTQPDNLGDNKITSNAFDIALENYNLFNVGGDFFSVGFMENATFAIGGMDKMTTFGTTVNVKDLFDKAIIMGIDFIIGPAIGLNIANIVKLQVMAGLALEYTQSKMSQTVLDQEVSQSTYAFGVGFAAGIQAKFFPKSFISPAIGFRYVYSSASKYRQVLASPLGNVDSTVDEKMNNSSFVVNLGLSLNF